MGKKTFIGYDLGDGESITDCITINSDSFDGTREVIKSMTMPGSATPGKAIPTAYAYDQKNRIVFGSSITEAPDVMHNIRSNFKRRPSDLLPKMSDARKKELISVFSKAKSWPDEIEELNTKSFNEFRNAVVTFTNEVFENEKYLNTIKSEAVDSEEIIFCVGHPTKWDDLDIYIYKMILQTSVLGKGTYVEKKSNLILAAESRAAYLTIKDKTNKAVLPKGTSALLIDIGSSTIDLTCVTADSHNYQFNSGSNYLGVRGIDYLIKDLYLDKLREDNYDYKNYEELCEQNLDFDKATTLACRLAKENVYSGGIGMARITVGNFRPVRVTEEEIDELASQKPLAPVLCENIDLSEEQRVFMGNKSWTSLYQSFLMEQKQEIKKRGITIGRIIMTGSASKMPFSKEIVKKVFSELPEDGILEEMDPSRSISMGLALVGPSNEKSLAFQKDLNELINTTLPKTIKEDLPELADGLSLIIEKIVKEMVKDSFKKWRRGDLETLDDMTSEIQFKCSESELKKKLDQDEEYKQTIKEWLENKIGVDIALNLRSICLKYGVKEIQVDDLNIFKVPQFNLGMVKVDVLDFMDAIIAVVAIIAGIVAAIILPTVLGIIVGLIALISTTLASIIISILLAIPGAGVAILIGIAGMTVVAAAAKGGDAAKKMLTEKVQTINLPEWVRKRMTDEKINKALGQANIKEQIKNGILEEESQENIVEAVTENLRVQIEKRAEDIKYVIESK